MADKAMAENVTSLEEAKKARAKKLLPDESGTHYQIAVAYGDLLTEETGHMPVFSEGKVWLFDNEEWIFQDYSLDWLGVDVGRRFSSQRNCKKASDYRGVTGVFCTLYEKSDFFEKAPAGIAAGGYFYRIEKNGDIQKEKLGPKHRSRMSVPVEPDFEAKSPLFDELLANALGEDEEGEAQKEVLQMAFGATLARTLWTYRKVLFLYGASSTGKSTLLDLLRNFFPPEVVGAVNPASWENEYHAAALAGKAVNMVGEIDGTTPIPGGVFKSFTGGDLVSGRHPTHKPIYFRCTASQIFNGNRLPPTRDKTMAFFVRWLIVEFSRPIPIDRQIACLADRIFEEEQAAVLAWMLNGAAKLAKRGSFPETPQHKRLIDYWRAGNNSALQFVMDLDYVELKEPPQPVPGMEAFQLYRQWAREVGVKALGRNAFYEALYEGGARLGVSVADDRNGVKVVRGIGLKKTIPG